MAVTRKNVAKVLYALMLLLALAVFLFATTDPGMGEVSMILHGAFILLGVYVVAAFALASLITGWQVKFIRYSILAIAGLIAGMFAFNFASEFYSQQRSEKRQAEYDLNQNVMKEILSAYRQRYLKIRSDPRQVSSLLAEIEEKLKLEGVDPECWGEQGCRSGLEYIKFKASVFLYLGIFVDEKFMDSISKKFSAAHFYTDFYKENASAFTKEVYFSRLFDALTEKSDHPDWLHENTQIQFSKTLAERGYLETYLQFIPLIPPEFSDTYGVQRQFLRGALTLAEKTGDDRAVIAVLDHSIYNYPSTGSDCELKKFDNAFDVLKESEKLDAYIEILFSQMPRQCGSTRWRADYEVDEDVYCYLQKNPDWVKQYTSDGKVRAKLLADIDCAAGR